MQATVSRQTDSSSDAFRKRDMVVILLAIGVTFYGALSLGCGGGNENVPPPETPQAGAAGGALTPPGVVRFALDDAGVEMALAMGHYSRNLGGQMVETQAVASGDWVLENFVYMGGQLTTVSQPPITDSVLLAAGHQNYDAEIVLWTVTERAQDGGRFVDAVADEWIERIVSTQSLLEATGASDAVLQNARDLKSLETSPLEGLHFSQVAWAGRSALQVDMLRVQPGTRVRQHVRLVMLRQVVGETTVMVFGAIAARRDDMLALDGQLETFLAQTTLIGQGLELAINPNRNLGAAGDEYGVPFQLVMGGEAEEEVTGAGISEAVSSAFIESLSHAVRVGMPESRTRLFDGSGKEDEEVLEEPVPAGDIDDISDDELPSVEGEPVVPDPERPPRGL